MSNPIQTPAAPNLRSNLDAQQAATFDQLRCASVGIIKAFDRTKQTASVQIASLYKAPTGQLVSYPLLTDCPVYFPGGGSAYMVFPVRVGDPCLVVFNDFDLDNWFGSGAVVEPNSTRKHSLSDGFALVGVRHRAVPVPASSPDAVELWNDAGHVTIDNDGIITLETTQGGGYSRIQLTDKVNVQNPTGSLKAALDQLCDTLSAWVNTGGSTPNPATLAAITAAKAKFDALLS